MESNQQLTIYSGYAHSLTDLNNDFIPDFTLAVKRLMDKVVFEQWIMDSTSSVLYTQGATYDAPDLAVYGQSIFADYGTKSLKTFNFN